MFNKPNPRPNFFEQEESTSKWWKENKIFEKSISNREGAKDYIFYDGPPFMSGMPHYAHLMSSMAKDIIPRYQTMKGKKVERVWGWDCHGLPIENKVEKELNLNGKKEIEEYGLDKFIEKCYEWNRVGIENWKWYIERIGRWVDIENAYRTLDQDYMESVWWTFKAIWDNDLIYKGRRTSLYSTDFSTPVSDFEVSMDPDNYADAEDIAVTVRFKLTAESQKTLSEKYKVADQIYLLAWTTTPWTLPSNFALAVKPKAKYVLVKAKEDLVVLIKDRLEVVMEGIEHEIISEVKASELEGLSYEQLFTFLPGGENDFKVYSSDYVTTEDGTGILHVAPAFGEADAKMGEEWDLSFTPNIDDLGNMTIGPWVGVYIREANPQITEELEKTNKLFKKENYTHRLPFYRGKNPLIYKTEENYFINIQKLKEQLIKSNEEINWFPEYLKEGRFKYILDTAPDWSISRTRSWCTPMPIWQNSSGDQIVIGSRDQLMELVNASKNELFMKKVALSLDETDNRSFGDFVKDFENFIKSDDPYREYASTQANLSGLRNQFLGETEAESKVKPVKENEKRAYFLINGKALDLHRPYIDTIKFSVDGQEYTRIQYTLDVWMDSGSMPFAQFHYPFVNKEKFEESFPGDYIAEYTGQIRAWFYVLHVISNSIFKKPAFKNALVTGVLAGTDGRKMSKVYGNYPDPKETIIKYSGDALRLYFLGSPILKGNDINFNEEDLRSQIREIMLPLWNIYTFLATYANIHKWSPANELAYNDRLVYKDEHPWDHIPFDDIVNNLDAWVLVKLEVVIKSVNKYLDSYDIPSAIKVISEFIQETSKWYIRRSRSRFAENDTDALNTLYYVVVETLKLLAPITPFLSEHIYREIAAGQIDNTPESIHLCDYPVHDDKFIDSYSSLFLEMQVVQKVCELGHEARGSKQIKVRQPLSTIEVANLNDKVPTLVDWMKEIICEELNIKEVVEKVTITDSETVIKIEDAAMKLTIGLETSLNDELKNEGLLREITRKIQAFRKDQGFQMGEPIDIKFSTENDEIKDIILNSRDKIQKAVNATTIEILPDLPNGKDISFEGKILKLEIVK